MWLLNIKKKTSSAAKISSDEKNLLSKITRINARGECISPELYRQLRNFEVAWLERNYDFNSLLGINSIPVKKNLPGAPTPGSSVGSHTGEVYYYLRHKAYCYEDRGDMALALACMRKSVALVQCRDFYTADDCYPLVKMLARAGCIDEATREKALIEKALSIESCPDSMIEIEAKRGREQRDYLWIQANLPDKCPKTLSGFRRMKSQNSKNFQHLQQLAAEKGRNI